MNKTIKIAAIVGIICIVPVPHMVAPRWSVTVVDESHRPRAGLTVRESSQDYSLESTSHEVDLTSSADGRAIFPARYLYASVVQRMLGAVRNIIETGVHASFGTHTWVLAFGKGLEGYSEDWHGNSRSIDTVIVVQPQNVPIP